MDLINTFLYRTSNEDCAINRIFPLVSFRYCDAVRPKAFDIFSHTVLWFTEAFAPDRWATPTLTCSQLVSVSVQNFSKRKMVTSVAQIGSPMLKHTEHFTSWCYVWWIFCTFLIVFVPHLGFFNIDQVCFLKIFPLPTKMNRFNLCHFLEKFSKVWTFW